MKNRSQSDNSRPRREILQSPTGRDIKKLLSRKTYSMVLLASLTSNMVWQIAKESAIKKWEAFIGITSGLLVANLTISKIQRRLRSRRTEGLSNDLNKEEKCQKINNRLEDKIRDSGLFN